MTVIIEKNALYSESDYIISLTLESWLCSFLCSPVALLFSHLRHRVYNSQLCSLKFGITTFNCLCVLAGVIIL